MLLQCHVLCPWHAAPTPRRPRGSGPTWSWTETWKTVSQNKPFVSERWLPQESWLTAVECGAGLEDVLEAARNEDQSLTGQGWVVKSRVLESDEMVSPLMQTRHVTWVGWPTLIQFVWGFPSFSTEGLVSLKIPQSQENWDSLTGTVLVWKLQGPCPENYFSREQSSTAEEPVSSSLVLVSSSEG